MASEQANMGLALGDYLNTGRMSILVVPTSAMSMPRCTATMAG